jgi:organic radical activating enzyme
MYIKTLNIEVGNKCTMACSHCANESNPKRTEKLTSSEQLQLIEDINCYKPNKIIFTGGEPFLYIDIINNIINNISKEIRISITTNGFFATNIGSIENELSSIVRLNQLQLSFDSYHSCQLNEKKPELLKQYCQTQNIEFCIVTAISKPSQLCLSNDLQRKYECKVIFQCVEASGRARKTHSQFQYSVFDRSVLAKKCPNSNGDINYVCGKGYSICCSNVCYNIAKREYFSNSISKLSNNIFLKEVSNLTMLERMKNNSTNIENYEPYLSSPCSLCELIEVKKHD